MAAAALGRRMAPRWHRTAEMIVWPMGDPSGHEKPRHLITPLAGCLLACAFVVGASVATTPASPLPPQPDTPAAPTHTASNIPQLLQDIKAEIGEATCDADDQCHSIGVGQRPCGGPEAWLAWSSKVSDRDRLTALTAQHRDARRMENARSGLMSDCRAIPDPGAVCRPHAQDGRRVCQLGQSPRGRAD
jgi:hypothetical protein